MLNLDCIHFLEEALAQLQIDAFYANLPADAAKHLGTHAKKYLDEKIEFEDQELTFWFHELMLLCHEGVTSHIIRLLDIKFKTKKNFLSIVNKSIICEKLRNLFFILSKNQNMLN
jgi:hypothetical protein